MPSQPITELQFQKLLEETRKTKNKFIVNRDILMYELLFYLGLRPSECRLIKVQHISFSEKTIFIPAQNNKQHNEDVVYMPEFIQDKILNYLRKRKINSNWLFPCAKNYSSVMIYGTFARKFTKRLTTLEVLNVSYIDKQGRPRYHLNLYSFRKRFGTFAYKKTRCPQTTALLLRHTDKQYKAVWSYIFAVQKEERKEIMQELYN